MARDGILAGNRLSNCLVESFDWAPLGGVQLAFYIAADSRSGILNPTLFRSVRRLLGWGKIKGGANAKKVSICELHVLK